MNLTRGRLIKNEAAFFYQYINKEIRKAKTILHLMNCSQNPADK